MKPEWREVLSKRSVADKFAIAIDCDVASVEDIPIVAELVRDGIAVWVDRAMLPIAVLPKLGSDVKPRVGINCDIYQLTAKGIELCDANGIKGH